MLFVMGSYHDRELFSFLGIFADFAACCCGHNVLTIFSFSGDKFEDTYFFWVRKSPNHGTALMLHHDIL